MPPPSGQQSQGDTSLGPFWIIIGIFAAALGIWYIGHEYIAAFVLRLKLYEAEFVSLFLNSANQDVATIKSISPRDVSANTLSDVSTAVGNYLRYPFAIILGIFAVIIYFSNPALKFKKTYSMQKLLDAEKTNWPQISPVAELDLIKEDIDTGPWAMALAPMAFGKKYNLLTLERIIPVEGFSAQSKINVNLRREDAHRVFALQLGRYWRGIDNLSIHAKALFAVFAARADRNRDGANKLLMQIAASTQTGKLNFSGVEELLAKHKNNRAVIKVTQKHAYVLTVLASMLELARTDGVVASADFLWLKPVDRPLWFMLNAVGRQTPFTEISGPFAHWLAEKKIGHKLNVPVVEEAVNALEKALQEIIYVPDENEEEVLS